MNVVMVLLVISVLTNVGLYRNSARLLLALNDTASGHRVTKRDIGAFDLPSVVTHLLVDNSLPENSAECECQDRHGQILGLHFRPVTFWRGLVGIVCLFSAFLPAMAGHKYWWALSIPLIACGLLLMFPAA